MSNKTSNSDEPWWKDRFTERELEELETMFQTAVDDHNHTNDIVTVEANIPRDQITSTLKDTISLLQSGHDTVGLRAFAHALADSYIGDDELEPDDEVNEALGWMFHNGRDLEDDDE